MNFSIGYILFSEVLLWTFLVNQKGTPYQLKLGILGGRDRTCMEIWLNRGFLHTPFLPLLLDIL